MLGQWELKRASRRLDAERTERTLVYTDPNTGLEVRCVSVAYADFPVVEWTVYFRNTGGGNTPILENIQALDVSDGKTPLVMNFVLHGVAGRLLHTGKLPAL